MRLVYLAILVVAVGIVLWVRACVDRKVEKITGKEIVREGEELLGTWGSKSAGGYFQFRLRRDGTLDYMLVQQPANDTTHIKGTYTIATGNNANYFPRIQAFGPQGDTLFNYFVQYVTPYGSTVDKYDRLVLNPNSVFDTISYQFYRIKQ